MKSPLPSELQALEPWKFPPELRAAALKHKVNAIRDYRGLEPGAPDTPGHVMGTRKYLAPESILAAWPPGVPVPELPPEPSPATMGPPLLGEPTEPLPV